MLNKKSAIYPIYVFIDIILISLSFYIPYIIRFGNFSSVDFRHPSTWANFEFLGQSDFIDYVTVYFFWIIFTIISLFISGLYRTERSLSILKEAYRCLRAVFIASVPVVAAIFFLQFKSFSRLIFLVSLFCMLINLSCWRILKRIIVRQLIVRGYDNTRLLIIGAGKAGLALAEEIDRQPYLGIKILGFLDDKEKSIINNKYKVLDKISNLKKVIQENFIEEVIITIPSERSIVSKIIETAKSMHIGVRIVPDNFDDPFTFLEVGSIGFMPILTYKERTHRTAEFALKYIIDFIVALILIVATAPLFFFISILIKLDSPGNVFYIQKRMGRKGRIFNFYKFRSMVKHADKIKPSLLVNNEVRDGVIFKIKEDPRITRIGRFLRRYSLDELPQLYNVLFGEMSLVGPRPFPLEESQRLNHNHMPRLNIKPGITGLSQIKGRSDLTFRRWVKWDLWYLNHWSLSIDIWILWHTSSVVFKAKGAY